jgi:hypothetical protein
MSATVPGTFDCGKLLEIKEKIDQVWEGEKIIDADYIADVEPYLAIKENQTANLQVLEDPSKDYDLKINWLDDCDDEDPDDCGDQCEMGGEEIGDMCEDLRMTECFEKKFKITENKFRTSIWSREEVMARALLRKMKILDEFWAAKAIAFMEASAGVNKYAGQFTVVGNETRIPAVSWNPDVFGYMDTALWMNKFRTSKMLSGTLLKQYMWKVGMEVSDPTGASQQAKMTSFGVPYFDRRLDTILGEKTLFLFNQNSVATATKARHKAYGEQGRWVDGTGGNPRTYWNTIESKNLPGIVYDLYYAEVCENDDVTQMWKIKTRGDFFLNPKGCDDDRTGVLKFVCV